MLDKEINILGAGLCGSLLSIMMAKQGYSVTVREKGLIQEKFMVRPEDQ